MCSQYPVTLVRIPLQRVEKALDCEIYEAVFHKQAVLDKAISYFRETLGTFACSHVISCIVVALNYERTMDYFILATG